MFATQHLVSGYSVTIENTRPDIETSDVLVRLSSALALIDQHTPHYGRHLRRDLAGLIVRRFACRGAYFPDSRLCLVELTFCVNPEISEAQIAATILHEGMHARLHALGIPSAADHRAREERFCRRAEIEFGLLVPGGDVIVARALAALRLSDQDVAPQVDWQLAQQRVAEADRAARESR
jgi:hypothetical protein